MRSEAGPQALYFGPADGQLFGWLHLPADGSAPRTGLVICNPFGFEEVCAHRSLRDLAAAAAASGIATLRFDYAGCGDSAGDEFSPRQLESWVASVHEAAAFLKCSTGLDRVCLLGLRLGAAVASLAAVQRDDVQDLIAIAPVIRGRGYLRELRALDAVKRQARAHGEPAGEYFESAGFLMTRETSESIAGLDLHALPRAPAGMVLIVERDDLPGSDGWAETLQRLGADASVALWPGYIGMMDDPRRARTPDAIVQGITGRLSRCMVKAGAGKDTGAHSARIVVPTNAGEVVVREKPLRLDTGSSVLFGILTDTLDAHAGADRAGTRGVVMLNAGSVHRIGPDRMWVQLARAWAARGFVVLRLDISGIGDSPPRQGQPENEVYSGQALEDVALALNYMRDRLGVQRLHLLGLCSGAYHAFKAAAAGHAIDSAVMINPLTFHWREGTVMDQELLEADVLEVAHRYRRTVFSREPWVKLLRGQLHLRLVTEVVVRRVSSALIDALRDWARVLGLHFEQDLAEALLATVERGIRLSFVFAATSPGYDLLRRQGGRVVNRLRHRGGLSIDLVEDADHTFTHYEARKRLIPALERLMFSGPDWRK